MPAECATPSCHHRVSRRGSYCTKCAAERRLATQRARRQNPNPAGPLPPEIATEILTTLALLRDKLDLAERQRHRIQRGHEPPIALFPVFDELTRETRAALTSIRELTAGWEDRNAIRPRRGSGPGQVPCSGVAL